jgi:mycothiol synthase
MPAMRITALPAGFTARSPRPTDAEPITALVRGYTRTTCGFVDYTLADTRDQLTEPGFHADTDGRLVFDQTGRLVGYGFSVAADDVAEIDVTATDERTRHHLLDWTLARATAIGRERGYPRMTVDHGAYRADEPLRTALADRGFASVTTFHRMRIDHPERVNPPQPPEGVAVRPAGTDREVAHRILEETFADHFNHVAEPYERWHETLERRSTFDWSQLWLAELDNEPVGVLLCRDDYAEDENRGYVSHLGVLKQARGKGIATFLLRYAFAVDAAAGRTGTLLHVDTNNVTPALRLYESVGMRSVLVLDIWELSQRV